MKLVIAFSALTAFATAQDYCAGNCESDDSFGRNDCHCDAACVDLVDCCDDYEEACVDDSRGSGDESCRGCPSGPQPKSDGRGSCYCDAACVNASDCCDSYEELCGFQEVDSNLRANFCNQLHVSKTAYCDVSLKVATFFPVEKHLDGEQTDADNDEWRLWAQDSFDATCKDDPEITGDAITCYASEYSYTYVKASDENDGDYWRFGISGLSVYQNYCFDDDECNECDDVWLRTAFGVAEVSDYHWDNFYAYGYSTKQGKYIAAIPGVCGVTFDYDCRSTSCDEQDELMSLAGVFGSGEAVHDVEPTDILIYDMEYANALQFSGFGFSNDYDYVYGDPHMADRAMPEDQHWVRPDEFSSWTDETAILFHLSNSEYMAHKIAAEITAWKWQAWMTENWEDEENFDWSDTVAYN